VIDGFFALARNLVDLVDVDDAPLALFDVVAGGLEQLEDDVLDVFADVAGFGQRGGIDDGEGNREQASQRLSKKRLTGPGGSDQEDIRFLDLHFIAPPGHLVPLVVVVHGDRELLLRRLLADDVLIEESLDLDRLGKPDAALRLVRFFFFGDDVEADVDAFVADVDGRSGDELPDVALALVAEGALEPVAFDLLTRHRASSGSFVDDVIDQPVFPGLGGRHDEVAIGVVLDTLQGPAWCASVESGSRIPACGGFPSHESRSRRPVRRRRPTAGGSGFGNSAVQSAYRAPLPPGAPRPCWRPAQRTAC
jgi:hypothetical protein